MSPERKPNRTPDEIVRDLEQKIASVKARAERKKRMANPAVKLARNAIRLLEKAVAATDDAEMKKALQDAALTVNGCIAIERGEMLSTVVERVAARRRRSADTRTT